ncbi:aldo/keto reductase [Mariniblastus sp.]|nr:aldo/keto reductase [Mariniblastus sp.]MDA7925157.1 aldo/keto reductase [Mariniblastus sp.]MDA7926053.1 aldo/keto reductase [Mariniblastus sp.]
MAQLGLGMASLGRPGYINLGHGEDLKHDHSIAAVRKNAFEVLNKAWDSGIRHFDAARSYGRAEEFVSQWVRDASITPQEIIISSKWGYTYTAAWKVQTPEGVAHEVKRHELPVLQRQYATSFNQLGDHLKLYQIHSATEESGVLDNHAVLQFLDRIRQTGTSIGLSVSGPRQSETIEKALTIKLNGERLFQSVQATWNLLERSSELALKNAHDLGLKVIIKESVANGRLTSRNQAPEFRARKDQLSQLAREHGTTIDAISIAAALNQPWAGIVLSGATTADQVTSNVAATTLHWDDELENQTSKIAEAPTDYWNSRAKLDWN